MEKRTRSLMSTLPNPVGILLFSHLHGSSPFRLFQLFQIFSFEPRPRSGIEPERIAKIVVK
jgi:hypothetical protein